MKKMHEENASGEAVMFFGTIDKHTFALPAGAGRLATPSRPRSQAPSRIAGQAMKAWTAMPAAISQKKCSERTLSLRERTTQPMTMTMNRNRLAITGHTQKFNPIRMR